MRRVNGDPVRYEDVVADTATDGEGAYPLATRELVFGQLIVPTGPMASDRIRRFFGFGAEGELVDPTPPTATPQI